LAYREAIIMQLRSIRSIRNVASAYRTNRFSNDGTGILDIKGKEGGIDMNAEYIRLCSIPAVQERIRKGMNGRQLGDRVIDPVFGEGVITSYSNEQSFGVTFLSGAQCGYSASSHELAGPALIRLPQVHDLSDEKRGLWGMVDWGKVECFTGYNGEITIAKRGSCEHISHQLPPEIALLRSLCYQWGIEG